MAGDPIFTVVQNDSGAVRKLNVGTLSGKTVDLTGKTVHLIARFADDPNREVVFVSILVPPIDTSDARDYAKGDADFTPTASDLALAGDYVADLEIEDDVTHGRETAPTLEPFPFRIRDDVGDAPVPSSMDGADTAITNVSLNVIVPEGTRLSAYRDGELKCAVDAGANGVFSLGVVSGSTYTIRGRHPGYSFPAKVVNV